MAIKVVPAALLILLVWSGFAQQEEATIRVSSRLVSVDVLVTDRRTGVRVENLRKEDFEVLDDGVPVSITHFSSGDERERPFALVLLVEVNNSIHPVLPNLESKLDAALRGLRAEDHVAVMIFDPYNSQMLQELTTDREQVLKAFGRAKEMQEQPGPARPFKKFEALPNALLAAMAGAKERLPGARLALVVIGSDFNVVSGSVIRSVTGRLLSEGAAVSGLLKSDGPTNAAKLIVSAMTLPSGGSARASDTTYFSQQTGGEVAKVRNDDYGEALARVVGNTAHRYSLGFVPAQKHRGQPHKLTVRLPRVKGNKLRILARRAYLEND